MSKVIVTYEAKEDLKEIKEYISATLGNPSAAKSILKKISDDLRSLKQFPRIGTPLQVNESSTDYRFLVHNSYVSFYRIQEDTIIVDRIIYGRRNYMKLLFGNYLVNNDEIF